MRPTPPPPVCHIPKIPTRCHSKRRERVWMFWIEFVADLVSSRLCRALSSAETRLTSFVCPQNALMELCGIVLTLTFYSRPMIAFAS
jgi:hypothetical protein